MRTPPRKLNIFMNSTLIGTLNLMAGRLLSFSYDQQWLNTQGARPISLSLPLSAQHFSGDIVYNFFDNLLPDNPHIRTRIQTCFQIATDQPFDLLANIGKDCVGALQLLSGNTAPRTEKILCQPLQEKEIASLLRNTNTHPLGMSNHSDDFRISIAGAQEKSAFLYWAGDWNRPLGATPTTHIFKLPIGYIQHQQMDLRDSCENEWLCAQIAKAFGLPVAPCEIKNFEEIKVLIVERFDRKRSADGKNLLRLPQEDLCQALGVPSHLKYQVDGGPSIKDIMKLLLGSSDPEKYRDLFFRTQILFWLLAAIDGHAKNFSIFIDAGGNYRLTPLYDIMSAHPLIANQQLQTKKIKMAMALIGKNNHYHWYNIQRRHFLSTAKMAHYSVQKAEYLLDEMLAKIDSVIETVSHQLPNKFPHHLAEAIFNGMLASKIKLS